MYTVEALFFPTKIILIDDDPDFLKAMHHYLSKKFHVEAYDDPHKVVNVFTASQCHFDTLSSETFIAEAETVSDVKLDLDKIYAFAKNKEKYKIPTMIISDYEMPIMNGIQLFEKLSHLPIMKMLLTGKSDLKLALDAFNRGLVNKFLIKNTEKMLDEINMNILACQHDFFSKISYPIFSHLDIPRDSLLHRSDFAYHFKTILQNNEISEYYLMDTIGSFLLMTKNGQQKYFTVMLDRQFDEYLDVAITSRAPAEIIDGLKNRTHAPVFMSEADYKLPANDWVSIMKVFVRRDEYYFCFLENFLKKQMIMNDKDSNGK